MTDVHRLGLYAILPRTRALGPFDRFALWVQGCPRACPGCMTPDARPFRDDRWVSLDALSARILAEPGIEGITVSGGEPFCQAEALSMLLERICRSRDMGVIAYTGFTREQLWDPVECGDTDAARRLLSRVDLLIDGPYVRELDDGLSLRGSSNQRIHLLTGRYAGVAGRCYGATSRHVELHLRDDGLFLAGIPGPDALKKWRDRTVILPGPHEA